MIGPRALFFTAVASSLAGCAAAGDTDESVGDDENEVRVDTRSPEARRQYDANVAFARQYTPRCAPSHADPSVARPRVLVTGFGRFMSVADNATGRILSTLVPSARYPETAPPAPGEIDDPAPQLSVATETIDLPGYGEADVCAMILPVYWDLAAILIAKEVDAFQPAFVLMNGVADTKQPLWIELGATNRAAKLDDGSNQLRPAVRPDEEYARIVETASPDEDAQGNLLGWRRVEAAAREAITRHADDVDRDVRFSELLPDVKLAGYPRSSNTYLCNNVTYVTGWLMTHPGREVRLLRASPPKPGAANDVRITMHVDHGAVPRVFVHWPSELAGMHHEAAADVMRAILTAQLDALRAGEAPTLGDNADADPSLRGGEYF